MDCRSYRTFDFGKNPSINKLARKSFRQLGVKLFKWQSNAAVIPSEFFCGCEHLMHVDFDDNCIMVTEIGERAFTESGFMQLFFPDHNTYK